MPESFSGNWKFTFNIIAVIVLLNMLHVSAGAQGGPTVERCPALPADNIWNTPLLQASPVRAIPPWGSASG